ncbi:MAG: phospholipase [Pedobacter sp.]|nr:MAG: phospholipase [Pedobacter sp.]
MYTHDHNIVTAGAALADAKRAFIFLHGRGATAEDILSLSDHFDTTDTALMAPQASNNSWYPYSFIAPVEQNQPALDSALEIIKSLVTAAVNAGIPQNAIYFVGFSQGACLTLEYVTRNAAQYGGVVAFTGGLIGKDLNMKHYKGDFKKTPILITTGDPDPHVPVSRVQVSAGLIKKMNANVSLKIYPGRVHTISQKEIDLAKELILK